MRLVKKSVNQDDPGTYHLFYADADGHPGTDLTFFPFRNSAPGRLGHGLGVEIALAIPSGSFDYWQDAPRRRAARTSRAPRRGAASARSRSPIRTDSNSRSSRRADERLFRAWDKSPVPDRQADHRSSRGARVGARATRRRQRSSRGVLGFTDYGEEDGWHRYRRRAAVDRASTSSCARCPTRVRGAWGIGTMHHVAWRVADETVELRVRERIAQAHRRPTEVIDRFWFKSVYFLEPGGVLFELATDGPGFTADEELDHLGETARAAALARAASRARSRRRCRC